MSSIPYRFNSTAARHPAARCRAPGHRRRKPASQAFSFDRSLSRAGGMTFWHINISQRIERGLAERISH
jgi:hypothetical protein